MAFKKAYLQKCYNFKLIKVEEMLKPETDLNKSTKYRKKMYLQHLYINLACLSVCLSVCLCVSNKRQNGWTDRAQIFCGTLGTPGKVYEWSKFQIFVSIKIRSSLNFLKFWKSTKFFVKIRELFLICFTMYTKRTCSQLI